MTESAPDYVPDTWVDAHNLLTSMYESILTQERKYGMAVHHLVMGRWVYDVVQPLLGDDGMWRAPDDRLFSVEPSDHMINVDDDDDDDDDDE